MSASHITGHSRDPLEILIRREGMTCKGCAHIVGIDGWKEKYCDKGQQGYPNKKCGAYREGGDNGHHR